MNGGEALNIMSKNMSKNRFKKRKEQFHIASKKKIKKVQPADGFCSYVHSSFCLKWRDASVMEGIYLPVFVKDIPLYDTPYIFLILFKACSITTCNMTCSLVTTYFAIYYSVIYTIWGLYYI